MKITSEMTRAAYLAAKEVYHGRQGSTDAIDQLEKNYGMNKSSAEIYIANFKKMMDGDQYKRALSVEVTRYSFSQILSDYGPDRLRNALKAAREYVRWHYEHSHSESKSIQSIILEYESILHSALEFTLAEEIEKEEGDRLTEGAKKLITVNAYERNQVARSKCIEHHGTTCVVCSFSFEEAYEGIGKGFIHIHHLTPLSDIKEDYEIKPVDDLRPVCPNCHAMLHKKKPPYSIEELKNMLRNA